MAYVFNTSPVIKNNTSGTDNMTKFNEEVGNTIGIMNDTNSAFKKNKLFRMDALKNVRVPSTKVINSTSISDHLGTIILNTTTRYLYFKPNGDRLLQLNVINNQILAGNDDNSKVICKSYIDYSNQTHANMIGYKGLYGIYDGKEYNLTHPFTLPKNTFNDSSSKTLTFIIDGINTDVLFTAQNATYYNKTSLVSNNQIPFYEWYDDGDYLWFGVKIPFNGRDVYGWIKTKNSDTLPITVLLTTLYCDHAIVNNPIDRTGSSTFVASVDDDSTWIAENFDNPNFSDNAAYFDALYSNPTWSMKSFKSVIGLPFHFMHNVDQLVGTAAYGKQFIEDILYDMPIVCLRPGGPVMNSSISGSSDSDNGLLTTCAKLVTAYQQYVKDKDSFAKLMLGNDEEFGGTDEGILEAVVRKLFIGKYSRFYTFSSDYQKYVEYVNTLCHVFIEFLDIGNLEYTRADNTKSNYSKYQDTWELMEDDQGNTMKLLNGPNMAIYGYYQPESQIGESFSNSTTTSSLAETMKSASSSMKQATFMLGVGGINNMSDTSFLSNLSSGIAQLSSLGSSGIIGRLFSAVGEGIGTVIGGNNIDLPEIYDDSSTSGGEETLIFKLVSPYGDRESIFLYILRPLARLMAMSLPRQFGPNSYRSPFLVQAFSKGHFNIQCGIVTNLSIRRGGNGGESHTINNIPTELEVTMTIKDMYGLVTLSNEYLGATGPISAFNPFGAMTASRLLFNNIGLIDFCASYCGYNLNSPEQDTAMTLLMSMWANRISDNLESPLTGYGHFKSPKWNRTLSDAFYDAVTRLFTFING